MPQRVSAHIVATLKSRIAEFDQSIAHFERLCAKLEAQRAAGLSARAPEMAAQLARNSEVVRVLKANRARAEAELAVCESASPYPDPRFPGPDERAFR